MHNAGAVLRPSFAMHGRSGAAAIGGARRVAVGRPGTVGERTQRGNPGTPAGRPRGSSAVGAVCDLLAATVIVSYRARMQRPCPDPRCTDGLVVRAPRRLGAPGRARTCPVCGGRGTIDERDADLRCAGVYTWGVTEEDFRSQPTLVG